MKGWTYMPRVSRRVDGKMLTAEERSRPDHGANGPAMKSRMSRIVETIVAGVTQRQVSPAETWPIDHYEQTSLLNERQVDAARRLALYYARGFGHPNVVARLIGCGSTMSEDRALMQSQARAAYHEAMEQVPHSSRQTMAEVVRHEFPRRTRALLYLRVGCDKLADFWGFPTQVTRQ